MSSSRKSSRVSTKRSIMYVSKDSAGMHENTSGEVLGEPGRRRRRANEGEHEASKGPGDKEFEAKILKALRERIAAREVGEESKDPGALRDPAHYCFAFICFFPCCFTFLLDQTDGCFI